MLAYINGVMPTNVFSHVFQLIGIITLVPLIVTALFAPAVNLVSNLKSTLSYLRSPADLAGVAAVGAAAGVAFDRDAIIEQVQTAREEAAEPQGSSSTEESAEGVSGAGGVEEYARAQSNKEAARGFGMLGQLSLSPRLGSEGPGAHSGWPRVMQTQSTYRSPPNMSTVPIPPQPSSLHRWLPPDLPQGSARVNGGLVYRVSNHRSLSSNDTIMAA